MALSRDDAVKVLNDLLETCYDGLEGFRSAVSRVEGSQAIALFQSRVQRIDEGAAELYTAIRRLGGQPAERGHRQAVLHRGWMHLVHAAAPHGDAAILAEVERGEEEAVRRYQHASRKSLPPDLHDLVEDQLRGTEENLERVRELRALAKQESPPAM